MAKSGPKNNYRTANNYGANTGDLDPNTAGTQNYASTSMYTDNHYMDGDGALYWTGMIAQRVLVKGDGAGDLTTNGGLIWAKSSSSASDTTATLGVHLSQGAMYDGTYNNEIGNPLKFVTGQTGNLAANNGGLTLNVDSDYLSIDQNGTLAVNFSALRDDVGQDLEGAGISWNGTNNCLDVNYGTGLTIGTSGADNGKLIVDTSTIVPNITGTAPIFVSTSGNSKVISLAYDGPLYYDETNEYFTVKIDSTLKVTNNGELSVNLVTDSEYVNAIKYNVAAGTAASGLYVPKASSSDWGAIKTGYTTSGGNVALQLDSNGKAYVGLTTASGSGITIINGAFSLDMANIAGDGLSYSGCTLNVNKGAGITSTYDSIMVDLATSVADADSGSATSNPLKLTESDSDGQLTIRKASTSNTGVVQLQDSIADGVTAKVPTVNAVYDFVAGASGSGLAWDGTTKKFRVNAPSGSNLIVNSSGVSVDTASDVSTGGAKPPTSNAVSTYVTTAVAEAVQDISGREYKIFSSLPTVTTEEAYEANKKYLALIADGDTPDADAYIEYILIREGAGTTADPYTYRWERVGNTKFVSDDYVAKTDVLTQADITAIVTDVFGF